MRALVVYCHPSPESFTAAVRDLVLGRLAAAGAEVRLHDLYAAGFGPVLSAAEWHGYAEVPANRAPVAAAAADLAWCDTLLFVYPTWWYGPPAMLKGWLDRVLLPGVAFLMPDAGHRRIRPGLGNVRRLGVFTTCGAPWWLAWAVGAPGRRMLLRGVGWLCAPRRRTAFVAHYRMDTSTPASRARHLARVGRAVDRLIGPAVRG
ncbi:MAG: NAD(P)H-dependent oxidoreductase [Rhodobacteraceae bacterium]|jgi:putative NADPH-quinone reductase|nr:NAD(P)H-dependent oxidoreductase [Paracoccaceae bacterium]